MKDYYAILQIQQIASAAEVKSAYKRLALKLHPDKQQPSSHGPCSNDTTNTALHGVAGQGFHSPSRGQHVGGQHSRSTQPVQLSVAGVNAERLHSFQDVQEAYATLSDDFKRMLYDAERQSFFHTPLPHDGATDVPLSDHLWDDPMWPPAQQGAGASRPGSTTTAPPPPMAARAMSSSNASALLRMAAKEQFFEENNTKWEALFQERGGTIERRPLSRVASGRSEGRRPPLDVAHGARWAAQGTASADAHDDGTPQQLSMSRPNSRLAMLRRLRPPSSTTSGGPKLADMHSRPATGESRDGFRMDSSTTSQPAGASAGAKPRGGASPHLPPPLASYPSQPSAPRTPGVSSQQPRESISPTDLALPQFRPAAAPVTSASTPSFPVPSPQLRRSVSETSLFREERSKLMAGMSAARRKQLGIGLGSSLHRSTAPSRSDILRANASKQTMRIFFA